MNTRGQGLSLNFIVKIILAVLVLSTIIILFTGGISRLSSSLAQSSAGATSNVEITAIRSQCTQYCLSMDNLLATPQNAGELPYCTTVFSLKEDGNPNDEDHCYDTIVTGGTACQVTLSGGRRTSIGQEECLSGGSFGQVGGGTVGG
ncbi:hypothetical protein COT72_03335 [archaeon CG10_big_fil_rev_8_21_14_0_10_43_11]|nr:MAG: hypothetical protein COT72_03335 [archaeon CG10_big_fil_rev_8_21_14_0_10_43_11]